METINSESKQHDLPEAMSPPCPVEPTTEVIPLWNGNAELRQKRGNRQGTANVFVDLLPRPQIKFEFCEQSDSVPKSGLGIFRDLIEGTPNVLGDGTLVCESPIGTVCIQPFNSSGGTISGAVNEPADEPAELFDSAKLLVVNGPEHMGSPLKVGTAILRGRLQVSIDDVTVTVDRLFSEKQAKRSVFAFTHVAEIRFKEPQRIERFEDIASNLFRALSLMKGRWVGLVGPWLYSGGSLHSIWPRVAKVERNGSSLNWCHEQIKDAFAELFSCLLIAYRDAERREAIQTAFHWLVESQQCAGGVEGGIILQQAALEALAWFDIVQNRKLCSSSGFDKLPAADKIRWLASIYSIPTAIPTQSDELVSYAKEFDGINDLLDVLVDVRNALIHGTPKKVKRLFGRHRGEDERTELWWMTTGLLEQALLAIVGYQGKIQRRDTDAVLAISAIKQVPWAKPDAGAVATGK